MYVLISSRPPETDLLIFGVIQVWTAGQVIGMINDIPTCDTLVNRIEKEAIETLNKVSSLIVDEQPPPNISGKKIGEESDPRDDGASVPKSKL